MPEVILVGVLRRLILFFTGGLVYFGLELFWRGWSHGTMFLAGGACFLLLGRLEKTRPRLPLVPRALLGATVITSVELLIGMLANGEYRIWDYRDMPGNFHGQICLPFFLLWLPLSLGAMKLYGLADRCLRNIIPTTDCREHTGKRPSS